MTQAKIIKLEGGGRGEGGGDGDGGGVEVDNGIAKGVEERGKKGVMMMMMMMIK